MSLVAPWLHTRSCHLTIPCHAVVNRLTPSAPLPDAQYLSGDEILFEWDPNDATRLLEFNLLYAGTATSIMEIATGVDPLDGNYTWQTQPFFPGNDYWVAVTFVDTSRVRGSFPVMDSPATESFTLTRISCTSHTDCDVTAGDTYCDVDSFCYPCQTCLDSRDAIDGACPAKCGGDITPGGSIPNDLSESEASRPLRTVVREDCTAYTTMHVQSSSVTGLTFLTATNVSEPTRMVDTMYERLEVLVNLSLAEFGPTDGHILVTHAFEHANETVTEPNLHFEGRAIDFTLLNHPSNATMLAQLSQLAANAGMDYVTLAPAGDYIHASVVPPSCSDKLDLVFVIDGSGSIVQEEFGGAPGNFENKILPFVSAVVDYFDIGPTETQVGVTVFSHAVFHEIHLNTFSTKSQLLNAINNVFYPSGLTHTSVALQEALSVQFNTANGMRTDPDVKKVMVVISDGQATSGFEPAAAAAAVRNAGIEVFSMGIGHGADLDELNDIASDPDSSHVSLVKVCLFVIDLLFLTCVISPSPQSTTSLTRWLLQLVKHPMCSTQTLSTMFPLVTSEPSGLSVVNYHTTLCL